MDTSYGENVLVPLFGIFCVFVLPVGAFVFFRLLKHRERIAMYQSGLYPQSDAARVPYTPPRYGGRSCRDDDAFGTQRMLERGIRLAFIGLALFLGLSFIGYHHGMWEPGPWLLGGLIPLFVGASQVTIALMSGATFGTRPSFENPRAPEPPPSAPPPSAPQGGPYTYRPGDRDQLRAPTRPPDRR